MNSQEIEEKAVKLFDNFDGVYARDTLPTGKKRNAMLVMNTDTSNLPGQHWVAVIIRRKVGYCFDSLGFPPSSTLSKWMNRQCDKWSSNTNRRVQPMYSELCGYYCLYFLYWCSLCVVSETDFNTVFNSLFPNTKTVEEHEKTIKKFIKAL